MCVGLTATQPMGAPYPTCASGFSTTSVTPGELRMLMACWIVRSPNVSRMACVPITVIGRSFPPLTGTSPVASPVTTIS